MNAMNFVTNVPYMLKGMLGLFIALGVITIAILVLNKVSE